MAKMYSVADCKIYIGDAAIDDKDADFQESDFSGVSWVEIKGWVTLGAHGDAAALVTSDQVGVGRTKKAKGTRNAGTMDNVFDVVADDAGQLQLAAAEATSDNWPIRVVYNDTPSGGGTPSENKFIALVMSVQRQGGGANDPRRMGATLEINSNLVFKAAA